MKGERIESGRSTSNSTLDMVTWAEVPAPLEIGGKWKKKIP